MKNRGRFSASLPAWFAANPVAANLLMVLIVAGGIISVQDMAKQAYPRFAPESIRMTAEYPGAGPSEIEESVCIPIEESVHDLEGIKRLTASAIEGKCTVTVHVLQDFPIRDLSNALRSRVQAIKNLPKAVERIDIDDTGWEYPAISVILYGSGDKLTLKRLAEQVRDELNLLPGVRNATLWDRNNYEISIQIPPERLRQQQLTLAQVAETIRRSSLDLPGGTVKAEEGEFQLRAKNTAYDYDNLMDLTLRTYSDGTLLKLGDVAAVNDGFTDQLFEYFSEGQPSETIGVIAEHDLVRTAETVKAFTEKLSSRLPEGIEVITRRDNARSFTELFDTLITQGIAGFLLVLAVLLLFLNTSAALWSATGVIVSVFGTLWWMPFCGITLNILSLFGFVLATGILVDDAIIVSERIHFRQTTGNAGLSGAILGVTDIALPVALGVIIGLIAFLPGLFVPPSWATRFMKPVAVVMMLTLGFSLLESLLILPAHLAAGKQDSVNGRRRELLDPVRDFLNGGIHLFVTHLYRPFLRRAIEWRYLTLAVFAGVVIFGWSLFAGDHVKVSLEEDVGYDNFHIHLRPPPGTPFPEIQAKVQHFVDALGQAEVDLNRKQPPGSPNVVEGLDIFLNETDPQIYVEFSSEARKQFHIRELIDLWYRYVGDVGDFRPDFHTPTEQDVVDLEIELADADPAMLNAAMDELKEKISAYPDISEVEDSRRPGKPELRLKITGEAERLGVRVRDLAEQVRQAYYGEEVQRFIRGRAEVKIMLRYPREYRQTLQDLRMLPVQLPDGGQAPLGALAELSFTPGFGELQRENRRGLAGLNIRLEDGHQLSGEDIYKDLQQGFFKELKNRYPLLEISAGAAKEEAEIVAAGLEQNTWIALVVIYALIAVSFRSYIQPLLFMFAVPVAWTGALLIHWALGLTMSFQSLVGTIAASGVVVNDSVVLLDFIRKRQHPDEALSTTIIEACASRFRPIILVALTTLAGFFPMLFVTSEQANFLVPMALALTFGLSFGVVATLVLAPVCYAVLQDVTALKKQPAMS